MYVKHFRETNSLFYTYVPDLVQLKKEIEEKKSEIESLSKELRKKELDFNNLKNKNEKLILNIEELESQRKNLEEKLIENESEYNLSINSAKIIIKQIISHLTI